MSCTSCANPPFEQYVRSVLPADIFTARTVADEIIAYTLCTGISTVDVDKFANLLCYCRTCSERAKELSKHIGNGPIFKIVCDKFKELVDAINTKKDECNMQVVIHSGATLFNWPLKVGPFYHWTVPISETTRSTADAQTISMCHKAIRRYIVQNNSVHRIIIKLIAQGMDSLTLMSDIMKKSMYGDKLLNAVTWCMRVLTHINELSHPFSAHTEVEQMNMCIQFLLWTHISKDFSCTVVSTVIQQTKDNILDLLEHAHNEKALLTMLNDRFNPLNYQRRDTTKELSAKYIENFATIFNEFENTVMTVEDIKKLESVIPTGTKSLNFADRCSIDAAKIKKIQTIEQLVAYLRENPNSIVEIKGDSCSKMYLANTDLPDIFRKVKHFWAFIAGKERFDKWTQVTHVYAMYEQILNYCNVFFHIAGMKIDIKGNCCFPELLSSEYTRAYGQAFERINTTTPITIPSGNVAYGVGTSGTNRDTKFATPILLRLNGIEITIGSMK